MDHNSLRKKSAPAHERHLRLLHMLLTSKIGFSKNEVFTYLAEYYPHSTAKERMSAEKMFQRDRETLAKLGIIVETISVSSFDEEDSYRYRVKPDHFSFPQEISFTPEEYAFLMLASRSFSGSDLGLKARQGLHRIQRGILEVDDDILLELNTETSLDLGLPLALYEVIQSAIIQRKQLAFHYYKSAIDEQQSRLVEPISILYIYGSWLLYAWDPAKHDYRNFLLKLMSKPKILDVDIVHPVDAAKRLDAKREIEDYYAKNVARVWVRAGSLAEHQFKNRSRLLGECVYELNFFEAEALINEICSHGPDVKVISPTSIQSAVVKRLNRILDSLTYQVHESRSIGK